METIHLLLVDDETAFLKPLANRLEKRGMSVETAVSGPRALVALADNSHVEVVVLDVKMPEMDGIQTLIQIKKQYPLVEVIMLTGNATVETAIQGMKLGDRKSVV